MFRRLTKWAMVTLDVDFFLKTSDRDVLERIILPWLAQQESMEQVLFVGCEWYTYGYRRWFAPETYWTLDADPGKKMFGSPRNHIIGSMANMVDYFEPGSVDLIICNGVFGWGLNASADVEAAFSAVHRCLRPGGLFLLGWNDRPARRPLPIENIAALRALRPKVIQPLGVDRFLVNTRKRHTYNLYVRP